MQETLLNAYIKSLQKELRHIRKSLRGTSLSLFRGSSTKSVGEQLDALTQFARCYASGDYVIRVLREWADSLVCLLLCVDTYVNDDGIVLFGTV